MIFHHLKMWSTKEHYRFKKSDRQTIVLLLLIQKKTNFVVKDVLLNHIMPFAVDKLIIPEIYISNLSFDFKEDELEGILKIPIDFKIARRRDGRSKGFGFFKCLKYDDFNHIIHSVQYNSCGHDNYSCVHSSCVVINDRICNMKISATS